MPKITISYRRADSDAIAGRIRDRLARHYGDRAVFMDIDSIPFGIDFREHIQSELANNDVLVAVIGPNWLGAGEGGRLRIAEETDPVRIEVETALARKIPVIPVLVQGAAMPRPDELPDTMKSFAFHNAAQVDTGRDFHPHVDRLIRSMDRILQGKGAAPARRGWLLGGIAAACVGLIAAGTWLYQATVISAPPTAGPVVAGSPPPQPAPPSPPEPVRLQAQPWQAFPQTAAAAFPAMIENLKRDGYRLRTISPYAFDGAEHYASLWIKEGGPDWQARHGLTRDDYQKALEPLIKDDYRMTWIGVHEIGGQPRYASLFEKKPGPAWRVQSGLTAGELQKLADEIAKEGMQPVHVYGYARGGLANFAAIFEKSDTVRILKYDLARNEMQR
jgi:Polyglycine hydrolase-like, structural repeat/TIR domain